MDDLPISEAAVEAAVKAVRHELTEVEALTEYSDRGADEICEDVARNAIASYIQAEHFKLETQYPSVTEAVPVQRVVGEWKAVESEEEE
jgi:hypothetical protein